jgi:hypothetical protein
MGSPYLSSDESLVLSTQNIAIDSVPSEAILTNQRIMLVDSRNVRFEPRDIPLGAIETVMNGKSENNVPFITLSFAVTSGANRTMTLTFSQRAGEKREQECDNWVTKLKEYVAAARKDAQLTGVYPTAEEPEEIAFDQKAAEAGTSTRREGLPDAIPADERSSGRWAPVKPSRSRKVPLSAGFKAPSGHTPRRLTTITIVAIICVVIIISGGVLMFTGYHPGKTTAPPITPAIETTLVPTTTAPVSIITPVITTMVTPVPTELSSITIPPTGVWVRVTYSGNFTGSVGISGWMTPVSGSGDKIYQIPTTNDIVEASIQKDDMSANLLTVEVYNNGIVVGKPGTTSIPSGNVDLHINLAQP